LTEPAKLESVNDFLEKMAFQKLKRLLKENAGLNCDGYRDEYLKRRFDVRLRATSSKTYGRYVFYVKKHPEEIQQLLNDLTINFTMFFRDQDVYQYLETHLLPKLLAASTNVRIWSAGCATGEEPYSLAILVDKALQKYSDNRVVTIFASDIDKDALAKAEKGEYLKKQLNDLPDTLVDKYFTKEGESTYHVRDFLHKYIRFEQCDLNKPSTRQGLDLILCRNVMIYFSKEGQQHVHMNFYNALRDGGFFITGKAEMLSGEPSRKFQSIDVKCRVYQKLLSAEPIAKVGIAQHNVSQIVSR
jgi:chemotaxis protein methyltransferase CheR